jgi:hypothetical protein
LEDEYARQTGFGGFRVYNVMDPRSEETLTMEPRLLMRGRIAAVSAAVPNTFTVYTAKSADIIAALREAFQHEKLRVDKTGLLTSTSSPGRFLARRYSWTNACAFLIDASSVMSSWRGTTVDDACTSDLNSASASSAAESLREPKF